MLFLPLSMNICQFWVIDYILKQKPSEKFPLRIDEDQEDTYGLVGGLESNYDEDGEDGEDHLVGRTSHDRLEHLTHHPAHDRFEIEDEDLTPKHGDDDFSPFVAASSRHV